MENEKLKLAFKLDRLKDKCGRYESHVVFLRKCLENNVIPNGLRAYVEPSIGNRDDDFLGEWHGILFECSKKLTNHSIDFSLKTIESTKIEMAAVSEQLKALVSEPAYKKIQDSLQKNDDTRNKDLTNRKNRKFYRLKYGDREREDKPQMSNNRQNEILNNRGQRGLGKPQQEDNFRNNNRNDADRNRNGNPTRERARWSDDDRSERNGRNGRNDRQPEHQGRFGNNNNFDSRNNNRGDRAFEERVLEVIERRTRNHAGATGSRGPRANDTDDSPIHERISLGRRNSRRNVRARTNESPREDSPPLSRERPREDHANHQSWTSPREGNDINRTRDHEIEALRKKIESLERERNGEQVTSHYVLETTGEGSKNGDLAQEGPNKHPKSNMDMKAYIKNAMEIICGFAEQLDQPNGSARIHLDK
jgi:hypothetical protein